MKIYCSDSTKFDWPSYIGKDVWIKCKMPSEQDYYVRPLHIHDGYLNFNAICVNDRVLTDPKKYLKTLQKKSFQSYRMPEEDLHVISPIAPITTAELFQVPQTEDAPKIFNKIIGKPVWILVEDVQGVWGYYYLHIVKKEGALYYTKAVGQCFVDDYEFDGDTTERSPSQHIISNVSYGNRWTVVEPMELLSDDEIRNALEHSDRLFMQGCALEQDDD